MPKGASLTPKQAAFALNLFKGMSQREAYVKAGYSSKQSDNSIDSHASVLAQNAMIVHRLTELTKQAEDATIMDVKERKQICTQGARGELRDVEVIETVGPDGSKTITKKVKAAPRSPYIAELNKMEKVYTPVDASTTINDNRRITVVNIDAKEKITSLLSRLAAREGESESPELPE